MIQLPAGFDFSVLVADYLALVTPFVAIVAVFVVGRLIRSSSRLI